MSPRPTSGYQYLCESEPHDAESPQPRPAMPAATELRRQILDDFQAMRIPLRPEQLDAALGRADSEGMSHLEFLRALINEQANGRRERSWPTASATPGSPRTRPWPTSIGSSMPRPSIGCGSRRWPGASSSAVGRTWSGWDKAVSGKAT